MFKNEKVDGESNTRTVKDALSVILWFILAVIILGALVIILFINGII